MQAYLSDLNNTIMTFAQNLRPEATLLWVAWIGICGVLSLAICWLFTALVQMKTNAELRLLESTVGDGQFEKRLIMMKGLVGKLVRRYKDIITQGDQRPDTDALVLSELNSNWWMRIAAGAEKIARWSATTSILVGLLGTFFGLVAAISAISYNIRNLTAASEDNFLSIVQSSLNEPLAGMGVAFISSIAGLVVSLLLSFFLTLLNFEGRNFNLSDRLIDFLNNNVFPRKYVDPIKQMSASLTSALTTNFDRSIASLAQGISVMSKDITLMGERINDTMTGLDRLVNQLEKAGTHFDQSSTRLVEFEQKLKGSVHQIDTAAGQFSNSGNQLTSAVNKVAEYLDGIDARESERLGVLRQAAAEIESRITTTMSRQLEVINGIVEDLQLVNSVLDERLAGLEKSNTTLQTTLESFSHRGEELIDSLKANLETSVQTASRSQKQLQTRLEELLTELASSIEAEWKQETGEQRQLLADLKEELAVPFQQSLQSFAEELHAFHSRAERLNETIASLQQVQNEVLNHLDTVHQGSHQFVTATTRLQDSLSEFEKQFSTRAIRILNEGLKDFAQELKIFQPMVQSLTRDINDLIHGFIGDARAGLIMNAERAGALSRALRTVDEDFRALTANLNEIGTLLETATLQISEAAATLEKGPAQRTESRTSPGQQEDKSNLPAVIDEGGE